MLPSAIHHCPASITVRRPPPSQDRIQFLFEFWAISNVATRDYTSFDDFLSNLKNFWQIRFAASNSREYFAVGISRQIELFCFSNFCRTPSILKPPALFFPLHIWLLLCSNRKNGVDDIFPSATLHRPPSAWRPRMAVPVPRPLVDIVELHGNQIFQ